MSSMAPITRLCVGHRLSEASVFNGIVHLGGMVPESGATDIRSQTADVLAQVDAVVTPSAMPAVLLGNSFLNRFSMRRDGDTMLLVKR